MANLHPAFGEKLEKLRLERAQVESKLNKIVDSKATGASFEEGFGDDLKIYVDFQCQKYKTLRAYAMFLDSEIKLLEHLVRTEY